MRILLSLSFTIFSGIIGLAQDRIEWSQDYRLTADDFKATPPGAGGVQTVQGHTVIEYQFANYQLVGSRNFNKNVTCYFYPTASWIDKGDQTPSLLRYAQTMFDMQEWMARELRKRFRDNKSQLLAGKQNEIYEQLAKEFADLQTRYARESQYGFIQEKQTEWEKTVSDGLMELADYCKTCKPPRKK